MVINQNVNRQTVSLKAGPKADLIKRLESLEPSDYSLVVERLDSLIRYSSDVSTLIHYEVWWMAAQHLGVVGRFGVVYQSAIVGDDSEGSEGYSVRLAVFDAGVCTHDLLMSEVDGFIKADLPLYIVDPALGNKFPESKVLDLTGVELKGLYTTNLMTQVLGFKKQIVAGVLLAVLSAGGLFIHDYLTSPEVLVVQDRNFIEVDDYADYRADVSGRVTTAGMTSPIMTMWAISDGLPFGWQMGNFTFSDGYFNGTVVHSGGSLVELKAFKESLGLIGESIKQSGQVVSVSLPVEGVKGSDWNEKISSLSTVRDGLLDTAMSLGADVRTKDIIDRGFYKTQIVEATFNDVGILGASELLNRMKKLPVFLEWVSVTMNKANVESTVVVHMEVIGNAN